MEQTKEQLEELCEKLEEKVRSTKEMLKIVIEHINKPIK